MAAASRQKVLRLYKALMQEGTKFENYNFRSYAVRKIRDSFKENKNVTDQAKTDELLAYGKENLELLKRQVLIGHLYSAQETIIEKKARKTETNV